MQRASHFWERVKRFKRHLSFRTRSASFLKSALFRLRQGKSPVKIIEPLEVLYRRALSIQAWSPPDDLESQIEKYSARPTRRPRAIIYTAIIGGHDKLMLPEIINPDYEYVCFSDRPIDGYGVWQIRTVPYIGRDSTRTARFVKTHPFLLLDDADYYVWVDGNIRIVGDIETYFNANEGAIGFFKHPLRHSIMQEAQSCIDLGKDDPKDIQSQIARYKTDVDPDTVPLFETNFFVAQNTEQLRDFFATWWHEIDTGSKRDQLSAGYSLVKTKTSYSYLLPPGLCARNHEDFQFIKHLVLRNSPVPAQLKSHSFRPAERKSVSRRYPTQGLPSCDVIVCVHNALEDTRACLDSVLQAESRPETLILVNDASNTDTSIYLREFAEQHGDWVMLHENTQNLGYTKTANKGLSLSSADLRVLLNSDTIVSNNWLAKMAAVASADQRIGIVGTLSNAASYQSLPSIKRTLNQTSVNELPPGVTPSDMDKRCEEWSTSPAYVPLIHGFCLGVRRDVLDAIGFFDEVNFEKYYGEENDFCLRAKDAGFLAAVATDTFIYHAKSKSIAEEERILWMAKAGNRLRDIHGDGTVRDACTQMEKNPILVEMREISERHWK